MVHIVPSRCLEINQASPQYNPENPEAASGPPMSAHMGGADRCTSSSTRLPRGKSSSPQPAIRPTAAPVEPRANDPYHLRGFSISRSK